MLQELTAQQWILVDVANQAGFDKLTLDSRVWKGLELVETGCDNPESPWEFAKAVKAYKNKDENHMVYLDAKTQALQLYAVLTGDLQTAKACGLCEDKSNSIDAYESLTGALNKEFGTDFFTRKICKKPLMVTTYGHSKAYLELTNGMTKEQAIEYEEYEDRMEHSFPVAIKSIIPEAIVAMEQIQSLNNKEIGTYNWKLPDGFNVKYDVKSKSEYKREAISKTGITIHFSAEIEVYQASERNKGMAPNLVHSVDGYLARQIIRAMGSDFITTIHDAFGVQVKNANKLRAIYRDEMIAILESDLLNDIMHNIADGRPFNKIIKETTLTRQHIEDANYALS